MDEKKQEFDIEDIIREFGSEAATEEPLPEAAGDTPTEEAVPEESKAEAEVAEAPATEETPAPEEPPVEEAPAAEAPAEEAAPVTSDTVRLDPLPEEPEAATSDTVRLDTLPEAEKEEPKAVTGDTIRIQVIPDVQGTVRDAAHIEDKDEPAPYSEQWEPEYEQPIADYVPPKPITFRPKQRLREIKKQLVEGPEQEYYRLAEKGFGKLQLAIFLSFLVVLVSAIATVLLVTEGPLSGRLKFMIFVQFITLLLSALLGSYQLIDGLLPYFKKFMFHACKDTAFSLAELGNDAGIYGAFGLVRYP